MTRKTQVKCVARDSDERAEANGVELAEDTGCDAKVNVVASLQSVLAALKSASEFTSSGKSFNGGVFVARSCKCLEIELQVVATAGVSMVGWNVFGKRKSQA
jgi:hypothetical protein